MAPAWCHAWMHSDDEQVMLRMKKAAENSDNDDVASNEKWNWVEKDSRLKIVFVIIVALIGATLLEFYWSIIKRVALISVDHAMMIISYGMAFSLFPVRICCAAYNNAQLLCIADVHVQFCSIEYQPCVIANDVL
jgi:hypothetical protein